MAALSTIFDGTPADTEAFRLGASRIRSLKGSLLSLLGTLFADTNGTLQPGVVTANALGAGAVGVAALAAPVLTALCPVGTMLPYAGTTPATPTGWLLCNGQAVSQVTYSALFAALGGNASPWGGVSGGNFKVPDLIGRTLAGVDAGLLRVNNAKLGGTAAGGLTGTAGATALGGVAGEDAHLLLATESGLPAHSHTVPTRIDGGGSAPAGFDTLGTAQAGTTTGTAGPASAASVHNTFQPTAFINWLIKT